MSAGHKACRADMPSGMPCLRDGSFFIVSFVHDAPGDAGFHQASGGLPAPREFHPPEVLSELPPLLASVAGQAYHYRPLPVIAVPGTARYLRPMFFARSLWEVVAHRRRGLPRTRRQRECA